MKTVDIYQSPDDHLILVVDDDFSVRLLVTEALEQAGFSVIEAENGRQALEMFSEQLPSIVLLDVMMPEMDGFTACAELRELPQGEHVPVLMMTGLDDIESVNSAYASGATDFITKPINYPLLGHRVRYMLRAWQTTLNLAESEERLASAQRIANLGNWTWDRRYSAIRCSRQARKILHLEQDPPVSLFGAFPWVHESDRERVQTWYSHALSTGDANSHSNRARPPADVSPDTPPLTTVTSWPRARSAASKRTGKASCWSKP